MFSLDIFMECDVYTNFFPAVLSSSSLFQFLLAESRLKSCEVLAGKQSPCWILVGRLIIIKLNVMIYLPAVRQKCQFLKIEYFKGMDFQELSVYQRRIQDPVKHLRCSVLRK